MVKTLFVRSVFFSAFVFLLLAFLYGCSSGDLPDGFLDNKFSQVSVGQEERGGDVSKIVHPSVIVVNEFISLLNQKDLEGIDSLLAPEIVSVEKESRHELLGKLAATGPIKASLLSKKVDGQVIPSVVYSYFQKDGAGRNYNAASYRLDVVSQTHYAIILFSFIETKKDKWIGYIMLIRAVSPKELGAFKDYVLDRQVTLAFDEGLPFLQSKNISQAEVRRDSEIVCSSSKATVKQDEYDYYGSILSFECPASFEKGQVYEVILKSDKKDYSFYLKKI